MGEEPRAGKGDKQVRDAEARGEFERLPGAGKPLPADTESPYDELWWAGRKPAREGHSVLPPTPALRKEAEDALAAACRPLPNGSSGRSSRTSTPRSAT